MSKFSFREILSGEILSRSWFKEQIKLIVLIGALIFVYIYCGYQTQRQQRHLNTLQATLTDAEFTRTTLNSQLMSATRQSAIVSELQKQGSKLQESRTAPTRIK